MSELETALAWQMKAAKISTPETQYRFWDGRKFAFDFAWPRFYLAIEVDGGGWVGGRHHRPQGSENDMVKLNEATLRGWMVLRVNGAMVEDGRALKAVEKGHLAARFWPKVYRGEDPTDPDTCWEWDGARQPNGYGVVRLANGTTTVADRASLLLHGVEVPSTLVVDHLCHTKSCEAPGNECPHRCCVRPSHLAVVTQGDNIRRSIDTGDKCRRGHDRKTAPSGQRWCPQCQRDRRAFKL